MMTQAKAVLVGCIALVAVAVAAHPAAGQSSTPDSVHFRNECRLMLQVLRLGQPANKWDWALHRVATCGPEGGQALSAQLDRLRGAAVRSRELDGVAAASVGFWDLSVFRTALGIASDESAGSAARIHSFRILLSQVRPYYSPRYEDLVGSDTQMIEYDSPFWVGEPLPRGYREAVLAAAKGVADRSPPGQVKTAAENLQIATEIELRRHP